MRKWAVEVAFRCVYVIVLATWGCERQKESEAPRGSAPGLQEPSAKPADLKPSAGAGSVPSTEAARPTAGGGAHAAIQRSEATLSLTGLTMTVPSGWIRDPVEPGPMAAKAVFRIGVVDPQIGGISVRVTHFPDMKGNDDLNIDRWVGQVARADGSPATRDDVKIGVTPIGDVRVSTVDASGTIRSTMRAEPKPNQRMIAAIVDHPQGPHFVVAIGDVSLMNQSEGDILVFLKSARIP